MADINISFSDLRGKATDIAKVNVDLDNKLTEIKTTINSLSGKWVSDASDTIIGKITAMTPKFASYKAVIDTYVKFLNDAADTYEQAEAALNTEAGKFI